MNDYSRQILRLRFWTRTATFALIFTLPATFLAGFITYGTTLEHVVPSSIFIVLGGALVVAYIRIRTFPCPRCGHHFGVKHPLGANIRGRKCAYCGLEAYPEL
ncbi:hypothetical protein [Metallibacterium scheffleri]